MYPISNDILERFQNEQPQFARLTFNSTTPLVIGNSRIKQGGLNINRFCGTGVGNTASAEATIVLDNHDDEYESFSFVGKEVFIEVGVEDANEVIQYEPIGYFGIDESPRKLSQIRITALDRMMWFEKEIDWTRLSFPCTVTDLLVDICTECGVPWTPVVLTNGSYNITETPSVAETYRDLLGYICEVTGTNAYFDASGELVLDWFSSSSGFTLTTENRRNSDISEEAVVITGVVVETETEKYVSGSDAYPITVSMNPLITHDYQSVADSLKNKFYHFTYKPFSTTALPYPHLFPMDGGTYVDKNGNNIHINLTDWTFKLNGYTELRGKGESSVQKGYYKAYGTEKGVPMDEAIEILRANIIRTAEVINQNMETLEQTLTGQIEAVSSEFGEYKQESSAKIEANAQGVTLTMNDVQNISTAVNTINTNKANADDLSALVTAVGANTNFRTDTTNCIHIGTLWYEGSTPIAGVAISQGFTYQTVNGQKTIVRQGFYSTYTAGELAFYIADRKVAYVRNDRLYITVADITDKINLGRYIIDDEVGKGFTIKWGG